MHAHLDEANKEHTMRQRRVIHGPITVERRADRVWIVVVGAVDGDDAERLEELVRRFESDPVVHRVSVDLSCALPTAAVASSTLRRLRATAPPGVDVTGGGLLVRVLDAHAA